MRTLVLGLTALFLLPTVLALPPASLTPPLPSNASILPLNALDNGGFEAGLASWARYGHPNHMLPLAAGAAGSANSFLSLNEFYGGGIHQQVVPPVDVGSDILLDFYAKVTTSAARVGNNEVMVMSNWVPATGAGDVSIRLTFHALDLRFQVWAGAPVEVPAPTDGAWHHYQVLMVGALGTGVLLIDGMPAMNAGGIALATGDPASVDVPNRVLLGDTAWCDCSNGAAPDVFYDEFYLGPQV